MAQPEMKNISKGVALGVFVTTLVLQIVSVASPYWIKYDPHRYVTVHGGLWEGCVEAPRLGFVKRCVEFPADVESRKSCSGVCCVCE